MAKQSINWKESVEGTQQLVKHLGAKLLLETSIEKQEELRHEIGKLKNQEHVILVNELASEGIDKLTLYLPSEYSLPSSGLLMYG